MKTIWTVIKTEEENERAIKRSREISQAEPETEEGDELELLALLIENFEKEHYPFDEPDPIAAVKYRMEQLDINQAELSRITGINKSRVSEFINGNRDISFGMAKAFHNKFNIPAKVLLTDSSEKQISIKAVKQKSIKPT